MVLQLTNELLSQNNSHLSQKILRLQSDYNHQTGALEELTQKYTSLFNQAKVSINIFNGYIIRFLPN